MELEQQIFAISSEAEFNACALAIYRFQQEQIPVYREFVRRLNRPEPMHYSEIPFLPVSFFKTHDILPENTEPALTFKSSGTTGMQRSRHLVVKPELYEESFLRTYCRFIGDPKDQVILALLPNYIEQGESSLVYMVDSLIRESGHALSGFYLDSLQQLLESIALARETGKQVVLFGVSYALLDLAELKPDLAGIRVIETGGMKGRRKEMTKEELHDVLKEGFHLDWISSEYGMSELLSQAYSDKDGLFELPAWMKVQLRDVNDPLSPVAENRTGGVNIIDLANIWSCAFIATQDLGRMEDGKLRLMGRFDHSDIRGCNLLVQ